MTTRPALQKRFKGILHIKDENKCNQEDKEKNKY
jgi:hypothetical protein